MKNLLFIPLIALFVACSDGDDVTLNNDYYQNIIKGEWTCLSVYDKNIPGYLYPEDYSIILRNNNVFTEVENGEISTDAYTLTFNEDMDYSKHHFYGQIIFGGHKSENGTYTLVFCKAGHLDEVGLSITDELKYKDFLLLYSERYNETYCR